MSDDTDFVTEVKKLADLCPAEYNPRLISTEAFSGLGKSIERFGLLADIIWNKRTGNIVGGHQRYRQLLEKGVEETEVVVVDLDGQDEIFLNVVLNSKDIKGDYTPEAIEVLRVTEARLGDAFNRVRLDVLLEELEKKSKKKAKKKDKPQSDGYQDGNPINVTYEDAQAVVICPKCQSRFRFTDHSVVENNAGKGSDKTEGKEDHK